MRVDPLHKSSLARACTRVSVKSSISQLLRIEFCNIPAMPTQTIATGDAAMLTPGYPSDR